MVYLDNLNPTLQLLHIGELYRILEVQGKPKTGRRIANTKESEWSKTYIDAKPIIY